MSRWASDSPNLLPAACWWLSVHLWESAALCYERALLLSCSGCLGWEGSHTRRGSRDLSEPTQVPKAGPAWGRENKWAARDRVNYQAGIKKAADSVPLNICLLCNSYLQKHAKWHSAEVCLYLILLITLFPGSGLLNELSQFSWGGWNHLKTNFLFCFDGWSQPNLFLGQCIETPAHYFPFYFAVTRTVFYVRPKWLLLKPEQRMWFGHSFLLCVPKILVSQCSPYDQIDVYLFRSPPLLTDWIIIKKNWTHNS